MEYKSLLKPIGLISISLFTALSVSACVLSVADYYQDDYYPLDREVVVVERPPVVVHERPVIVRERRPLVIREPRPVYVRERRPVVVRERGPVVVHERPVVVGERRGYSRGPEVYHQRPRGVVVERHSRYDRGPGEQAVAVSSPPKTRGSINMERFRPSYGRPQPVVVRHSGESQGVTVEQENKSPNVGPPRTSGVPRHVSSPMRD